MWVLGFEYDNGGIDLSGPEEKYQLAESFRESSDLDSAKRLYEEIIDKDPDSKEAGFATFRINNLDIPKTEGGESSHVDINEILSVVLTTAPTLEGFKVSKTVDIITAECAFGMNLFADFFTSMTDVFGGKSATIQNTLREARKACLFELRKEAHSLGANAVIAVDLDYSEFSGKGKSMLFVVASGTAVKVEPVIGLLVSSQVE